MKSVYFSVSEASQDMIDVAMLARDRVNMDPRNSHVQKIEARYLIQCMNEITDQLNKLIDDEDQEEYDAL